MGAIKREMNSAKWTAFAISYMCVFAYAISLIVFQIGKVFAGGINVVGLIVGLALLAAICFQLFKPYRESTEFTGDVKVSK
jgi:ferrous iron transport protein B